MKCEAGGCQLEAEFFNPMKDRLCSDCIQSDVETGEYTWDQCIAIPYNAKEGNLAHHG